MHLFVHFRGSGKLMNYYFSIKIWSIWYQNSAGTHTLNIHNYFAYNAKLVLITGRCNVCVRVRAFIYWRAIYSVRWTLISYRSGVIFLEIAFAIANALNIIMNFIFDVRSRQFQRAHNANAEVNGNILLAQAAPSTVHFNN